MRTNKTKAKLKEGKMVLACWVGFHAPAVVEILACAGLDCVLLDGEHGGLTVSQVEDMVRAAEVFDITPIVRVPNHEPATIYSFLDCGAQGIVLPHINSKVEAEHAARAARYHPQGQRGYMSSSRPARWGAIEQFEYFHRANQEVLVIAQVEDQKAVQHVEEILSVEGIDMIMLGPGDLAQSMGFPPKEKTENVLREVTRQVVAKRKWVSQGDVSFGDDHDAKAYIQLGCRFWDVSTQFLLRRGAEEYRRWLKGVGAPL